MIDEKENLYNTIATKRQELEDLKQRLKTEFKTSYRNTKFGFIPVPRLSYSQYKTAKEEYAKLLGRKKISWDDWCKLCLELFNQYMTKLINEKENENPITK